MEAMVSANETRLGQAPCQGEGRPAARSSSQYSGVAYSGPVRGTSAGSLESVGRCVGRTWTGRGASLLPEVLEVLARLEADRASGGNLHFLARPWVAADPALARLHLEDAEPPQLDPLPAHHGVLHRLEDRFHRHFGLHLRDVGGLADLVDDVHLDHGDGPPSKFCVL